MQNEQKQQVQNLIKDFLTQTDGEFTILQGDAFVHLATGEFFTKTEHDKYIQKKLEVYKTEIFGAINSTANDEANITNEQILINKRSKSKKKKLNMRERYDGGNFNIVYRDKLEEVNAMKLNNNEKLVFYVLRDYVHYPTNCIMIKDKIPSIIELEPLIGLKEKTIISSLKSLEEKGLIKRVQHGHKKSIYFSPEYYASGKELEVDTLRLFDLLECDENKLNDYLE